MSLSVRYVDIPVGAQESASFSVSTAQPFGNAQQMSEGAEDSAWATLEADSWSLDGSRTLISDTPDNIGWWSKNRSGSDGRFATLPVITITFPTAYTATGITFWFWPALDNWCSEMNVYWYNGQTLLAQDTVFPDSSQWVLSRAVEGFDRIIIEVAATNKPLHFAKIQQIQIGQTIVFRQDEIVRVGLLNEVDHTLCELTADTMTVEIQDKAGRQIIPQENQQMQLYRDGKRIATQYITDFSREALRYYVFNCESAIGLLESDFLGGVYTGYPLVELLRDVLDGLPFNVATRFTNETVTGYLPVCRRREALQQIAFSVGALVSTQGNGVIKVSALPDNVGAVFNSSEIFAGAKATSEPQIAAVQVYSHRYTRTNEDETLLDSEPVDGESVLFVFSDPHHGYSISGGSISASGDNWVQITASGTVTLTGKKYRHATSARTRRNPLAVGADRNNIVSVEDATLVHSGNISKVLNRLYSAYQMRNTLTAEVVVTSQKAGQKASSVNPWGTKTEGYIVSMDSELTRSGHTASIKICGVEKALQLVSLYSGELYSGDTEVLY